MGWTLIIQVLVSLIAAIIEGIVLRIIFTKIRDISAKRLFIIVAPTFFVITFVILIIMLKPARWELEGRVVDATTGHDIPGAEITVQQWFDLTGTDGRFSVRGESSTKPSEVRIRVQLEEYEPVTRFVTLDGRQTIELEPR